MSVTYPNAPLQEALIEFHFEPDGGWDSTTLGLIYNEIKDDFTRKEQIATFNFSIKAEEGRVGQTIGTAPLTRFFKNDDERTLIQIAPYLLTVNRLRPYLGWATFQPQIIRILQAYLSVLKNARIQTMTVRYVNRIEFPDDAVDLPTYFNLYPHTLLPSVQRISNFLNVIQTPFEDERDLLTIILATSQEILSRGAAITLDLSYQLTQSSILTQEEISRWIDIAHEHLGTVFEECITDQLRTVFQQMHEGAKQ
jgi:uncharacterized protein (TIGR04255 family)